MSKQYALQFGNGSATLTSGLSPTFTYFVRMDTGATTAPPGITQIIPNAGLYKFNYTPSFPIYFEVDGATTGLGSDRYIKGQLDPADLIDEIGATMTGIMGNSTSAMGTNIVDPATLYGFLKRLQENLEGDAQYVKATGVWNIYDRTGNTLIATKTLASTATAVTKV